jgi:hypothetical protein
MLWRFRWLSAFLISIIKYILSLLLLYFIIIFNNHLLYLFFMKNIICCSYMNSRSFRNIFRFFNFFIDVSPTLALFLTNLLLFLLLLFNSFQFLISILKWINRSYIYSIQIIWILNLMIVFKIIFFHLNIYLFFVLCSIY